MAEGIVISLEILGLVQEMGYRGSKSVSFITVKEQRADGSSIFSKYCKVCPKCQGNLVFMHPIRYANTNIYSNNTQRSFFLSKTTTSNYSTLALNPNYVTGFTDGEGCFYVGVYSYSRHKTNYRVKATFKFGVHVKDLALLEQIKLFFGVGNITKLGADSVQFRVTGIEDLNLIINHFDKYPLLTQKLSDYLLFKKVINLMKQGKHLTLEGLSKIVSIKAILNKGVLSEVLSLAFPDLEPALRPEIKDRKIQDLNWLAGFTDAEGCFFIALKKSPGSKLGETV
jgi:hypothetical protein